MAIAMLPAAEGRRGLRPSAGPGQVLAFTRPHAEAPRFFLPELDALRLLAFAMVWTCHSLPSGDECLAHGAPGWTASGVELLRETGNLGVPIFFVLSAFLITELLRREAARTGTIALRNFYLRRVLRIWPLYGGVLAIYAVLGTRFHGFHIEAGRLLASALMAGNWYIAWHPGLLTPLRALWSVSVEEQFYAVWPVLARLATRKVFVGACIGLMALGQLALVYLARPGASGSMLHVTAWVNSLVEFQYFALGALLALILGGRDLRRLRPAARMVAGFAAAAAMFAAAGWFHVRHAQPSHTAFSLCAGYAVAGLGCALLVVAVLHVPAGIVPPLVQKLGKISFGLYVFHETGFFFASSLLRHLPTPHSFGWGLALNKSVALLLTIAMALLSYHFWERPFLRLKERFTTVRSREA